MSSNLDIMCERYGITAEWVSGPSHRRDTDGWEHHGGRVRLAYTDAHDVHHDMTTPFRVGMGIDPTEVTAADVVCSVASDARYGRDGFEDFCSELGYDTDSRKAYATWEQCRAMVGRFEDFCASQQMLEDLTYAEH